MSLGFTPGMPAWPAVIVTGGLVQVTVGWLRMPLPCPFDWLNVNSTVSVVRSVIEPLKLTGMPCSEDETCPCPRRPTGR